MPKPVELQSIDRSTTIAEAELLFDFHEYRDFLHVIFILKIYCLRTYVFPQEEGSEASGYKRRYVGLFPLEKGSDAYVYRKRDLTHPAI